jgi:hypothetical protein
MSKFKIKVNVELVECNDDEPNNDKPMNNSDGSFSMTISEQDAVSIDMCEKSVLQTAYPTIREAVSSHLSELSKKKRNKNRPKKEK